MSSFDDNGSFSSLFSSCFGSSSSNGDDRSTAGAADDVSEDEVSQENSCDEPEEDVTLGEASIKNTGDKQPTTKNFPVVKPDEWSQEPEPMENCPTGLEKLYQLDKVFMRRLPPKNGLKRYIVTNEKGELLFLFNEVKRKDSIKGNAQMRVYDQRMKNIWEFKRKGGTTRVYAPMNAKIMKVAPKDRSLLIYQKKNPILAIESVSTGSFEIKSLDGKSVGKMQKLSDSDRMASWPMDLLVEAKAACLVSLLLLETLPSTNPNVNPATPNANPALPRPVGPIGARPMVPAGPIGGRPMVPMGPIGARPIVMQPLVKVYPKWFPDLTGRWAPVPPPTPDCPPGMEPLTTCT